MALIKLGAKAYKAGSIIQVSDRASASASQTVSADSYTALTGVTQTITPSSTSSKILIDVNIYVYITAVSQGFAFRIKRGETVIYTATKTYQQYSSASAARKTQRFLYIDSPSSTSELTYSTEVHEYSNPDTDPVFNEQDRSNIILMEIAG